MYPLLLLLNCQYVYRTLKSGYWQFLRRAEANAVLCVLFIYLLTLFAALENLKFHTKVILSSANSHSVFVKRSHQIMVEAEVNFECVCFANCTEALFQSVAPYVICLSIRDEYLK